MKTRSLLAGACAAGLALSAATTASAGGGSSTVVPKVQSKVPLGAPFNLDISNGEVLVADGGLNLVAKLKSDGTLKTLAANQPGASGVERSGGTLAFTTTVQTPNSYEITASGLNLWGPKGKVYADTLAYEKKKNPDGRYHYGVKNPSKCVTDTLTSLEFPVSYKGHVDSHAYSVTKYKDSWIVADAGANALFRVDKKGRVSTLAVLPPQPSKVTKEAAQAIGQPADSCLIGVTYAFEAVPTDVEVGRDGNLYVTTLPGGPELEAFGARGAVWKVSPRSGKATKISGGFLGATNLALGTKGEIYVSEFYAGRISVLKHGRISKVVSLPGVVSVETSDKGTVWAGTMGSDAGPGTIVKLVNEKTGHHKGGHKKK